MKSLDLEGASLVLGGRNLWLEREGQRVPAVRLRYDEGRLRDRLEVAGRWYDVPRGRAKALMALLAVHRLRPSEGVEAVTDHAYVEERTPLEALGLEAWLQSGELVLAYLHTSTDTTVKSALGPSHSVPWRFVWTDRRAALLAVGPLGDVDTWPLEAMAVEGRTGRDRVVGGGPEGELVWKATLANEDRFAAIAPLLTADRQARLRAVVDASRGAAHRAAVEVLLAHDDDPRAPVEQALLAGESPPVNQAFVASMAPEALLEWFGGWDFGAPAQLALVDALQALDPASPHALALAEVSWRQARRDDPVAADLRHAEHLRIAGDPGGAKKVLEDSLAELPAPEIAELVPPGDPHAHLTDRVRLLEALAAVDLGAHERLARIEPLARERLAAAAQEGMEGAARALELLEGRFEPAEVPRPSQALTDDVLRGLRHPMSATHRFASTLQQLVATVDRPDHSALRRFCAPLKRPDAVAAFEEARAFLAVNAACYVSRGEDARGCRAHDDEEGGFVVLGAEHVEEGPLRMSADELRFVFACELAHLRLGHARVTQSDVWRGVVDKGIGGAELLLMALPLVRRIQIPESVGTILGAVKDGAAGQVWDKASGLFRRDREKDQDESKREALLVTHRLMQLSADRIGLALVGDPGPAVRSMLVLRGERDLEGAAEAGLADWVLRRTEGKLVDPDLAVRITALLAHWLQRHAS